MFSDVSGVAIRVQGLSKCYHIYDNPRDRLKQMLMRGRRKYYREFWALQDVSFEVKRGETVGIIGRNGSGKSTLLQLICGTLNPTDGLVCTNGRVAALLELGSGFNPEFTGRENVYLNSAVLGLSREEVDAKFEDILNFADIGDFIDQPVKTYSSGMMVRLAFAVIAHVDADVLIIDEALAVGDAFFTQKCMRFLREFMKERTVLFVSHDTAAVKALCTHVIWLDKGRILEVGSPKEISEHYLETYYAAANKFVTASELAPSEKKKQVIHESYFDQRMAFINASNLRNDIQVIYLDDSSSSFGSGGAQIDYARLLDSHSNALSWIVGGEHVALLIHISVFTLLTSPIIGFVVKDRLGQVLFGDNTWLSYLDRPVQCVDKETLLVTFSFEMPRLQHGDYSISVAVADGTQEEHVQHHWVHNAVMLRSESTSVSSGLIGIPMQNITIEKVRE